MVGGAPVIDEFEDFGWNGCWKCGALPGRLSRRGDKRTGQAPGGTACLLPVNAAAVLDALIANRRSCRRYQRRNMDRAVIDGMLAQLANAPNGGNKQLVEFTLLDDMESTEPLSRRRLPTHGGIGREGACIQKASTSRPTPT